MLLSLQVLLATGIAVTDAGTAQAPVGKVTDETPISVALGMKAGFIPPIAVVPELVVHAPHVLLGVFGIAVPHSGSSRSTVGAELGLELNALQESTPYLLGTYFHYDATTDASGFYERSDVLILTAGYEWKWKHFELQFGGGALFTLNDETPPCGQLGCIRFVPPILPALELGARYRF